MGFYRPLIRHHNGYSRFNHRDLEFRIGFGFYVYENTDYREMCCFSTPTSAIDSTANFRVRTLLGIQKDSCTYIAAKPRIPQVFGASGLGSEFCSRECFTGLSP